MTTANNFIGQINWHLLVKRMLLGAGIGLILIALFVLPIDNGDPAWGKFWKIRPLIVVPIAGAAGSAFSYVMHQLSKEGGWRRVVANALSVIVFIIGLWLGTVLGLVGTLWN